MSHERTNEAGVTMVEVLITVAIVGILSTVAVMQARVWDQKAKRMDGQAALMQVVAAENLYYAATGRYTGSFETLGYPVSDADTISDTKVLCHVYSIDLTEPWGSGEGYRVIASGNTDSDPWPDVLVMQDWTTD